MLRVIYKKKRTEPAVFSKPNRNRNRTKPAVFIKTEPKPNRTWKIHSAHPYWKQHKKLHSDRPTDYNTTRSSADADNRLDAFSGQSRSTNMVSLPFHMLHIVSSLRRAVFTIFVFQKFHDLEMGVKGQSRSLRVVSFDRFCMVSY